MQKRTLVALAVLITCGNAMPQNTIAIAPAKMNVFYIGVDNPVNLATSAGTDDKLTVTVNGGNGEVVKLGNGKYNVHVYKIADSCVLSVYIKDKLIGSSGFRVRELPAPSVTLGGYHSGDVIPAAVFAKYAKQVGLSISTDEFPFELKYEIVSFTFTVDTDKGDIASANCTGSLFSAEAIKYVDQYIKEGRLVTIDNIRVKGPDGRKHSVPSLIYYIK